MVSVAFIRTWSNAADEPMRLCGVSSVHRQRDTHHEVRSRRAEVKHAHGDILRLADWPELLDRTRDKRRDLILAAGIGLDE